MGQSPATRDIGHEFSKYRLREPLSDSFLGTRYRAVSTVAGSVRAASNAFGSDMSSWRSSAFALRLLRAQTPSLIDRVARAAKAVRHVDHPNVLAPIQLIRAQTKLGVITQDVEGVTLSEVLRMARARGEGLPQSVALSIAIDVLEGLVALHATEGDVTRYTFACGGLTPDSIHVGSDGRSRLLDPGVASAAASVPNWGHDPVALAYTAPDQTGAEPRFTPSSDGFSVGVVLWEMLSGHALFGAGTAAETLVRLHKAPIPRAQRPHGARGEPISAAVATTVAYALQRDPTQRYSDCRELASALRDAAAVGTHQTVSEYCRRLPSNSARAFSEAPAPAEIALPIAAPADTGPPYWLESLEQASSESDSVAPNPFEPDTERLPLNSADFPPPAEDQRQATVFPISNFIRRRSTLRRRYAPIAISAALVLLGLSLLAWQERHQRSAMPSVRAREERVQSASAPASDALGTPAMHVSTRPDDDEPSGPFPTVTRDPQQAMPPVATPTMVRRPVQADSATAPLVTPSAPDLQPSAAGSPAAPAAASRRRAGSKAQAKLAPAAATPPRAAAAPQPAAKFIPEDI